MFKVLEKSSDEYNRLIKFVKNTHASTHNQFDLNVQEVYMFTIVVISPLIFTIVII